MNEMRQPERLSWIGETPSKCEGDRSCPCETGAQRLHEKDFERVELHPIGPLEHLTGCDTESADHCQS